MRLLELGKDLKIKHSVSSPPYKTWRIFFWKKALHGGTNFLWQIHGGIFYMGIIDQIMQGQGGGGGGGRVTGEEVSMVESSYFSSH